MEPLIKKGIRTFKIVCNLCDTEFGKGDEQCPNCARKVTRIKMVYEDERKVFSKEDRKAKPQ